jgi:hypothetical protein
MRRFIGLLALSVAISVAASLLVTAIVKGVPRLNATTADAEVGTGEANP